MTIITTNPPELAPPVMNLYAQVVTTDAPRLAFVSGQVAIDATGELVGGDDHAAQALQAFTNVCLACAAVGARPTDIVQMGIHVVDHRPELIEPIFRAGKAAFGDEWPICASKLIGVVALGLPDWLIEVDAVAVVAK